MNVPKHVVLRTFALNVIKQERSIKVILKDVLPQPLHNCAN